jgi:peptidylprolyl isomerase
MNNIRTLLTLCIPMLLYGHDALEFSEALGHLIGKNFSDLELNEEALLRGLKEARATPDSPLTEEKWLAALHILQEEMHLHLAQRNLADADAFLLQNQRENGVIELAPGKLQIRIQQEGSGEAVQPYHVPLVKYEGKTKEGRIFCSSVGEEAMALDSVIEGLRRGIEGMREGEHRTLYIHPDLGFGAEDPEMPNALLIFDVEVIRADLTSEDTLSSSDLILRASE